MEHRNRSNTPQEIHPKSQEWILDSNSGLYWNSFHRVWAKYEDEKWTYADQDGNLVDNPDGGDSKPSSSSQRTFAKCRTDIKPSNGQRGTVAYQDIYEEEEGELASEHLDRRPRRDGVSKVATQQEERDDQEEGELDSIEEALLDFHDSIPAPEPPRPFPIRLVALPKARTSAVDPARNLLILQPGVDEPMIIGRDRTFEPSLRLKEMEVSKTHATLFWRADGDHASHGWHIVDNASTHGTFISPSHAPPRVTPNRLSKARKASLPQKLNHLDTIMVASAEDPVLSFQVHLHPRFPSSCQACALSPDESNRMSLDSQQLAAQEVSKVAQPREEERYAMNPAEVKVERERKRKIEMAKLRNQFFGGDAESAPKKLKKPDCSGAFVNQEAGDEESPPPQAEPKQYLDRAKLRRQTHGRCQPAPKQKSSQSHVTAGPSRVSHETQEPESMRRGEAMLAKLGGTSESLKTMGTLIEARTLGSSQAGLGSRELVIGVENIARPKDWRQEAKEANWKRYGTSK
ncbi:hypothetical protein PtA15_4A338 [Puccinia triticina]|uniref:FHA domain-containing protein n=1 Tax=Puccinia triticina TaxID=208348 RepID=A0ABY7CGU6_9BASI|nr:uncharacterized protein PtA15_4A338 [Puccinia triticina]WAQ83889.1 hypothetical protein PtA15_4A338 [Puccinia triticina]